MRIVGRFKIEQEVEEMAIMDIRAYIKCKMVVFLGQLMVQKTVFAESKYFSF